MSISTSMSRLSDLLAENRIIILDGSFGFQLNNHLEKGLDNDPLWSARALHSNQNAVIEVHKDYIKAGVDIIETNSYQASEKGFIKYLNLGSEDSFNLIKKSVELAKTAIDQCLAEGFLRDGKMPLIAGSIGPYGAFLHDGSEYNGDYTDFISDEELENYHRKRLDALVEGGVDLLAIETIPSKKEAIVLVEMLKKYPQIKAWLSFSCQTDGASTAHGDNYIDTVTSCYERNREQIIAVGVNCIKPSAVEPLLSKVNMNRENPIPLIVYANSGEVFDPSKGWDNNAECLEKYIPIWLDLGVKFIGGCCRVCSNYTARIKQEVHSWELKKNTNNY